jgi:energy-coupling factor transporter ATP-binding protein EcfA2
MLCFYSVKNYRGFKDAITLDLASSNYEFNHECVKDGYAHKALIYGHNGVGKSNLGLAIMDIIINLTDKDKILLLTNNYSNAQNGSDLVEFKYKFKFHDIMVEYQYGKIAPELLRYEYLFINEKSVVSYNRNKNEPLVINLPGTQTLNKDISKISISVLKYIKSNAALEQSDETTALLSFFDFVDRMLFFRNLDDRSYAGYEIGSHKLFDEIVSKNHFDNFKSFLEEADVPSNITFRKMDNQTRVFFEYEITQNNKFLIDFFENCSTGMKSLTVLFYWLQNVMFNENPPSFIFIDEFDAFYHQDLSEYVVNKIKKLNECQFILTTHDTGVMSNDIMRPDCLFLMNKNKIKSLSSLTDKELRFAHNIEKMYRAGAFDE